MVKPPSGLSRALDIIQAEIQRAEALLDLMERGRPVFDRAQTEAGVCALRAVAETISDEILKTKDDETVSQVRKLAAIAEREGSVCVAVSVYQLLRLLEMVESA